MHRVGIHGQQRKPDVVGFRDRATGPMFVNITNIEVLKIPPEMFAISIGSDLLDVLHHDFPVFF